MATIRQETETTTLIDEQGNVTQHKTEKTTEYRKRDEPDYIKIYTKMWCEANRIPEKWRTLFLSLVMRMTYATIDLRASQTVCTVGYYGEMICKECGWSNRNTLYRGLTELCKCGAIRKLSKGIYQINPQYAGRGSWQYNAKLKQGGVRELVAQFRFGEDGTISNDTRITWAEDDPDIVGNNTTVIASRTISHAPDTDNKEDDYADNNRYIEREIPALAGIRETVADGDVYRNGIYGLSQ